MYGHILRHWWLELQYLHLEGEHNRPHNTHELKEFVCAQLGVYL